MQHGISPPLLLWCLVGLIMFVIHPSRLGSMYVISAVSHHGAVIPYGLSSQVFFSRNLVFGEIVCVGREVTM